VVAIRATPSVSSISAAPKTNGAESRISVFLQVCRGKKEKKKKIN
jgi:hypothetical protein